MTSSSRPDGAEREIAAERPDCPHIDHGEFTLCEVERERRASAAKEPEYTPEQEIQAEAMGLPPLTTRQPEAWYHADFCHAFAWVYEDGDRLRVRWAERTGSDLYLHSKSDCDRCREIRKDEHKARDGEFTMAKPPEEFSSMESFASVLVEIAGFVPGLIEDGDDD